MDDPERAILEAVKHRIKALQDHYGENQGQIADRLGVSPSAVSLYLRANTSLGLVTAAHMARSAGVTMDWLCGLSDYGGPTTPPVDGEVAGTTDDVVGRSSGGKRRRRG